MIFVLIIILIFLLIILSYLIYLKIRFKNLLLNSIDATAEIIEYKKEKVKFSQNEFESIYYTLTLKFTDMAGKEYVVSPDFKVQDKPQEKLMKIKYFKDDPTKIIAFKNQENNFYNIFISIVLLICFLFFLYFNNQNMNLKFNFFNIHLQAKYKTSL